MIKNHKNIIVAFILISLCITAFNALADEVSWNATMQAANPLHWYRFDELPGDANCIDYGSAALDGIYQSLVDQGQEGVFGPGKAVRFERGGSEDVMWTQGGTLPSAEWTAEFIVKKMSEEVAQALCDSELYSLRLVGWTDNGGLGFTVYNVLDYGFDPVPGKSLVVPLNEWSHITFRKNTEGTQVFINGEMVGTTTITINLPVETFGGRRDIDWDSMDGFMDEVVVFDRAISDFELAKHSFAYNPPLIPDTFELYEDTPSLLSLWSGNNASVELTTEQVYEGNKAMKVTFGTGGSIIKDVPLTFNYTWQDGKSIEIWLKGDSANTEGDVTVTLSDPNGIPIANQTVENVITSSEWNAVRIPVNADDPNSNWNYVDTITIDVTSEGTLYFDKIEFISPVLPLKKVLQWDFDHTEGRIVLDTVNGVNGVLDYDEPAVWIENGGHTGQIGDHALYLGLDPNYLVAAYNVTAPEDVAAIFDADMDFSINVWVNFFQQPTGYAVLGGFGLGVDSPSAPTPAHSHRYIAYNRWDGVSFWPHYNDIISYNLVDFNNWHMMTLTYSAFDRYARIYLDGKEIASGVIDGGLVDAEPRICISPLGYDWSNCFEGLVDDFSIWQGILPWMDEDTDPTNDILSLWGSWICPAGARPEFDFDDDCRVGLGDIAIVAERWMLCGRRPLDMCDY